MVKLSEIAALFSLPIQDEITIQNVLPITDASFNATTIGWCGVKFIEQLRSLNQGVVIIPQSHHEECKAINDQLVYLPVENPRSAFAKMITELFTEQPKFGQVHPSAVIDPSVELDLANVLIAANVVIEKGAVIGKQCMIGANTVIKANTIIHDHVSIGANCTIGGVGFGYEPDETGAYQLMPHIGNVVLKDKVEIGNGVCIDRAVMGSTLLAENVKVDNLAHIAHGVQVGKNSLIIAKAMIAGSVVIGENVWVAPNASIRQKLTIGDNAVIGLGAVVVKDVASGTTVAGNPAKPFPQK